MAITTPEPERPRRRDNETGTEYAARVNDYATAIYGDASPEMLAEALRLVDRDPSPGSYGIELRPWLINELDRRYPGAIAATYDKLRADQEGDDGTAAFVTTMLTLLGLS